MTKLPKNLTSFFIYFLKPYTWYVVGMLITGIIWGLQLVLAPYLLKMIIDTITEFSGDKTQIFSAVSGLFIAYILVFFSTGVNLRVMDWLKLVMFPAIKRDVSLSMFSYLNLHSHNYFQNNFAGSLSNKISDMVGGIVSILSKLDEIFAQAVCAFIALIVLFAIHPVFALVLLGWIISFIAVSLLFAKKIHLLAKLFSAARTSLIGRTVDAISNIINVRLFARNEHEIAKLTENLSDTVTTERNMQWYILRMHTVQDLTIVGLIGLMLWALLYMYSLGKVTVGDFALVLTVAISIFQAVWFLALQVVQFAEEVGKCSQALTIINKSHDIIDIPNADTLSVNESNIEFKDVSFYYEDGKKIFEKTNIFIPAGQKVGLVGLSGSGKSTFVSLILRFFDLRSGSILIDGQDISKVTQNSLRNNIAVILQDNSLFHRTLMENIRYGKLEATDEEVITASKLAHCHEFINDLPKKYETIAGERGIKLSGGQRQRIAIARAILKNAPILILDEATSALDSVTEGHIQDSLHFLMQNRTSIVIAHRLSTLSEMDRILVFDKGHILEDGSHKELIKEGGHYAKMWEMQAGGFLPEMEEDDDEDEDEYREQI